MRRGLSELFFLGAGLGLMYVLDPTSGSRRRGRISDRLLHWRVRIRSRLERSAYYQRHLERRTRTIFGDEREVHLGDFDAGLRARIHDELRTLVRMPESLDLSVDRGVVTLSGWVEVSEHQPLIETIELLPGVNGIRDHLHLREPEVRRPNRTLLRLVPIVLIGAGAAGLYGYSRAD